MNKMIRKSAILCLAVILLLAGTAMAATFGQQNALETARLYLSFTAFSYTGLIEQLEYEGYSLSEATYAADNCGADWYEQAAEKARSYLSFTAFSYAGLVEQLEYEGFTSDQARSGAEAAFSSQSVSAYASGSTVSEQNALRQAKDYLSFTAFSYEGLVEQLEYEGYSHSDAVYAADNCGADWNEQAAKKAQDYLDFMSFSRGDLIDQLIYEGFTRSQAEYGVRAAGY